MRKFKVILLLFATLCFKQTGAQTFFRGSEYGIALGGSQYFGDLNDNYGFKFIRPAVGAFARLHLNPFISVRFSANITKVGYDDKLSSNVFNKLRNLNFQSDIGEVLLQSEFNFFRFATGELNSRFTPYLTGGVGVFYYNPYSTYHDVRYYLRKLGTEGQNAGFGKPYSTVSVCFPVGAGFKYWVRPGLNFGIELADRLTLTDYMDDVSKTYVGAGYFPTDPQNPNPALILQDRSVEVAGEALGRPGKQRGTSSSKDQYMMLMINLSFQLKTYKCPSYIKEGYFMY